MAALVGGEKQIPRAKFALGMTVGRVFSLTALTASMSHDTDGALKCEAKTSKAIASRCFYCRFLAWARLV
ncbi:MAG: hypothetical protein WA714_19800, partial [Candidatus Acidiferrales bacterium]